MDGEIYLLLACIGCAVVCLIAMAITVILYWLINRQIKKAIDEYYKEDCKNEQKDSRNRDS